MRRSQQERQRQQACARKERERERARRVTLDRRARVEHHSASRGGIACHAGRGEGSASGGSFLCACRALLLLRVGKTDRARLGGSSVTRCDHTLSLISGSIAAVTKISCPC